MDLPANSGLASLSPSAAPRWMANKPDLWFLGFSAATLLLPPLPLPFGSTGPHPAVLFLIAGLWVGFRRRSEWRRPGDPVSATALLFSAVLLLSVAFAAAYSGPAVAAGSLARVLLFAGGVYCLVYFAYGPTSERPGNSLQWVRWLYGLGAASALFACVDFYFQFSPPVRFAEQYVRLGDDLYRRAQGVFYDAGMLGNVCAFFLIMMAVAWLRPALTSRLMSRPALLAAGLVFSAALLFSFSRSSLLNLAAALGALLILDAKRIRLRDLVPIALTVLTGGLLLTYLLFPAFVESYVLRLWYTVTELHSTPQTLLAGRLETWQTLLGFLAANPQHAIFGVGFKTLPHSSFVGRPLIPDNMYLGILVETGVVGLAAMLALLTVLLRAAYRAARSRNELVSFLGTWTFCFWVGQLFQMLSADVLTYWRVLPLYFVVPALAMRESNRPSGSDTAD